MIAGRIVVLFTDIFLLQSDFRLPRNNLLISADKDDEIKSYSVKYSFSNSTTPSLSCLVWPHLLSSPQTSELLPDLTHIIHY